MSLENIQVYRNFTNWRVCTITLTGNLTSIYDLLAEDDQVAIGDRPVARVDLSFTDDAQIVTMAHDDDVGLEGTVDIIASAGPGRWIGPPVINAHKKVFLRESVGPDQLKVIVYIA